MSEVALPDSWSFAEISDIAVKGEQRKPELDEDFVYVDIGSIDRNLKKIAEPQRLRGDKAPSRARRVINTGDVLVSLTRPNLNAVAIVTEQYNKQIASTGFEVIKPILVDSRYIFALTRSKHFVNTISGATQGALYPAAKSADVQAYKFPLPPLAEQKIIAQKLDALLAQVENTKARLERTRETLKRFRQSVLASAVCGKLTEEWRGDETYQSFGSYVLPTSWKHLEINDIADVKGGKRLPKGEELVPADTGFPYIRAGQLKKGTVISGEDARSAQMFISSEVQKQISRYTVDAGDGYITIVGASIGDSGIIPNSHHGANLTENAAKLTNYKVDLEKDFLSYWLRSEYLQDIIQLETKSAAQGKLALKRIKKLPFPYPCMEEQTEIVHRVEQLFAHADTIEKQTKTALARVNNLTQSILAKAFRGELTEQWRRDNPELISGENSAEALLERIKAERVIITGKKAKARRKPKAGAKTEA